MNDDKIFPEYEKSRATNDENLYVHYFSNKQKKYKKQNQYLLFEFLTRDGDNRDGTWYVHVYICDINVWVCVWDRHIIRYKVCSPDAIAMNGQTSGHKNWRKMMNYHDDNNNKNCHGTGETIVFRGNDAANSKNSDHSRARPSLQ